MNLEQQHAELKLQELALYIAGKSMWDQYFGAMKLNKLLFFSDFFAFRDLGQAITGVEYLKWKRGPVPTLMNRCIEALRKTGAAVVQENINLGAAFRQKRLIPLRSPQLQLFTGEQIAIVHEVMEEHRESTATEISNLSHEFPAWQLVELNQPIPYQLIFAPNPKTPLPEEATQWAESVAADYLALKSRG